MANEIEMTTIFTIREGFDVEVVKKNLFVVMGGNTNYTIKYRNYIYGCVTSFVSRNIDIFGLDYLREVLATDKKVKECRIALDLLGDSINKMVPYFLEVGLKLPVEENFLQYLHQPYVNLDTIRLLVEAGQKWNKKLILLYVESVPVASYFIGLGAELTPRTVFGADINLIEYYCTECGFDVNTIETDQGHLHMRTGHTLLTYAFLSDTPRGCSSRKEYIGRLLALGADPQAHRDTRIFDPREKYGKEQWDRDFLDRKPFMASLDGVRWRFEYISERRLRAQLLTDAGLEEREMDCMHLDWDIWVPQGDRLIKLERE